MRKHVGIVLIISGLILLIRPSFDFDTIIMGINYLIVHDWPLGFVVVGTMLLWPQKHTGRKRKRS